MSPTKRAGNRRAPSVARFVGRILAIVLLAELGVMLVLGFVFPRQYSIAESVLDSLLLTLVVAPFVLTIAVRRRRAEEALHAAAVDSVLLTMGIAPFVVITVMQRRRAELEREAVIQELQAALANVRTLSGLLPICANCKKIRDDGGYWLQIELYVRNHSDAEFSHGLCPPCARTLYGEFADEVEGSAPPQRRRLDPRGPVL